jgi:hypothetical protein
MASSIARIGRLESRGGSPPIRKPCTSLRPTLNPNPTGTSGSLSRQLDWRSWPCLRTLAPRCVIRDTAGQVAAGSVLSRSSLSGRNTTHADMFRVQATAYSPPRSFQSNPASKPLDRECAPPDSQNPAHPGFRSGLRRLGGQVTEGNLRSRGTRCCNMRSTHARLHRLEHRIAASDTRSRDSHRMLYATLFRAQLSCQPAIAQVTADDTDPETFRYFREVLAWARSDHAEAERLRALERPDPSRARILAEEHGDHGRALARCICAKSPEGQRRQQAHEAALKKAIARMSKPLARAKRSVPAAPASPATPRPRSGRSKPG